MSAFLSERLCAKYGDMLIFLTKSDSKVIRKTHGNSQSYILPVTMKKGEIKCDSIYYGENANKRNVLFIGSDFPPNVQALEFLSSYVVEFVERDITITVAGKGMGKYHSLFAKYDNVKVFDFVPDLSEMYCQANAVLTPIFSGAGMKVKVAEALSYGKKVIGTSFSFEGYLDALPMNNSSFLIEANSAEDFINMINNTSTETFDSGALSYFTDNFDSSHQAQKLDKLLNGIYSS